MREKVEVIKKKCTTDCYIALEGYNNLSDYNLSNNKNYKEAKDIINEPSALEVHLLENEAIIIHRALGEEIEMEEIK